MVVKHNLAAVNSARMFGITNKKNKKHTEKLSSGYCVNRAADDAAGLAISEKMRRQIRGLTQASENAQDGISLIQSAEGALNEVHDMLQRGNELAVKAANGTLSDEDRALVDKEIQQLKEAIDGVAKNGTFNEIPLFPKDGKSPKSLQTMAVKHYNIQMELSDGSWTVGKAANPAEAEAGGKVKASDSAGSVLADKLANELIPNAISQILNTFGSLKTAVGSDKIDMALDISYLDGPSNTLAYAQCSIWSNGAATDFLVKVDTADFTDEDATGTGPKSEMLESTLAHELMHSVMQYTMTKDVAGIMGKEKLPLWFMEGTAQLSGGGYTTGWNDYLHNVASALDNKDDTRLDGNITQYLKSYTVAGRPYGHGYLACAYMGYLANGGTGDVTSASIANGMDKIFADILGGKNLSQAVQDRTGKTLAQIEAAINGADLGAVDFVRQLSYNSKGGAGSVVTGSLNVGGTNILGNTATPNGMLFEIDGANIFVDTESGGKTITLQVGAEAGQEIAVSLFQMDCDAIGLGDTATATAADSQVAIGSFKNAIQYVSNVRSYYGAVQNRLEHTINNLDNVVENTTAAESQIRDTDMSEEMVQYSNSQILMQVGQTMIAQANQQPQSVLGLLQ